VIVLIRQTGGIVGLQHLGPVDTDAIQPEDAAPIEDAVAKVDFGDDWKGEPSNTPEYSLHVRQGSEERRVRWLSTRSPEWSGALLRAMDNVVDWEMGLGEEPDGNV
jgi:hypothetical protein